MFFFSCIQSLETKKNNDALTGRDTFWCHFYFILFWNFLYIYRNLKKSTRSSTVEQHYRNCPKRIHYLLWKTNLKKTMEKESMTNLYLLWVHFYGQIFRPNLETPIPPASWLFPRWVIHEDTILVTILVFSGRFFIPGFCSPLLPKEPL